MRGITSSRAGGTAPPASPAHADSDGSADGQVGGCARHTCQVLAHNPWPRFRGAAHRVACRARCNRRRFPRGHDEERAVVRAC